jgi:hypothetical protein
MKTKFILLGILLCILTNSIRGQDKEKSKEEKHKFLIIEPGIDIMSCAAPEKDYLRALSDPYITDYVSDYINAQMQLQYLGVKVEYRVMNNQIGLSPGIRYTRMATSISRSTYQSDKPDYFYINFNRNGLNTEYAKIRELSQNVSYLGIPFEVRYYPKKVRRINVYYKAGASFNFKVASKSDVLFSNASMERYQKDVLKVVEKACPYYTTLNLGLGIKVGKSEKPGFFVETSLPVGVYLPGTSHFVKPEAGFGFQILVRVPLK